MVLVYAATGALAGYARRLFVDAAAEQASFEDRVSSLTEANALLSQLTSVALTLPSSLDLGDTVTAAMRHLGSCSTSAAPPSSSSTPPPAPGGRRASSACPPRRP